MVLIGYCLVLALCVAAGGLAAMNFAPYGAANSFSMTVASVSLVAMSLAMVLSARLRWVEPLFGGLDRMYVAHKWLGIAALAGMLLHDVVEPHFKTWVRKTGMGEFAGDLGEVAFYGFIVLILISWIKRVPGLNFEIPYQLWRLSHRLMGVLFFLVCVHQLLVDLPTGKETVFALYINGFAAIGVIAYLYVELIAPRLRRRTFTVASVHNARAGTEIVLRPEGRPMRWRAGQFAFVSAPAAGLSEPHPFTIASAPQANGEVSFVIKALGDWTADLPRRLKAGDVVAVEGPYGRFAPGRGGPRQIWLAGGVGITPFLAAAASLRADEQRRIHLVHCVSRDDDAIGRDVLERAATTTPSFTYSLVNTSRDGRLTGARLMALCPFPPGEAELFSCGPEGLRRALVKDLHALGQTPRKVHYERFEFR